MEVHGFTSITEGFSGVLGEKNHSRANCSPVVDEGEQVTLGENGRKSSRALSEAATCDDNQCERGSSLSPSYRCDGEGEKTGAPVHAQQTLEKCISRASDGLSTCNSSSDAAGVCGRGTCLILGSCICSQKKEPK